jgi:hypothetical protein
MIFTVLCLNCIRTYNCAPYITIILSDNFTIDILFYSKSTPPLLGDSSSTAKSASILISSDSASNKPAETLNQRTRGINCSKTLITITTQLYIPRVFLLQPTPCISSENTPTTNRRNWLKNFPHP